MGRRITILWHDEKYCVYFNPLPSLSSLSSFNTHPAKKNNKYMKYILFKFFLLNYQLNDCNNVISLTTHFFMRIWVFVPHSLKWYYKNDCKNIPYFRTKNIFWNNFYLIFIHFTDLNSLKRSNFGLKILLTKPILLESRKKPFHY